MQNDKNDAKASTRSPFDTGHLKTDLKGRSVRGGVVTILGQVADLVIRVASTMVLARLLVPADFGMIAMIMAVIGFADLFKDLGLSMATIQWTEITHEQVSKLFWINVAVSALLTIGTAAFSPAISWFYGEPRLTLITIALSMIFLLGGLAVQHSALLRRQMRFTELVTIQVISVLTGVVAAIAAAAAGCGYWALVIMQIISAAFSVIALWLVCDWRPGRPVRHAGLRDMLVFGGNITGFNIVNYFARNADNILIGRVWGAGPLGFYSRAYSLLMLPLNQINVPLAAVTIPALSRLHCEPSRYGAYYLKMISLVTLVATPLVAFCVVCSSDLILLILGPQWAPASKIFSVLGVSGLILPLYYTQGWLHISAGRSDRYLRWGLVASLVIVLAFIIGLPYGPLGVAISYTLALWAIIVPGMWYAGRSGGIGLSAIFVAVGKNIAAGISSIASSIVLLEHILIFKATWVNLLIGLCCILVTYSVFLLLLYRNLSLWYQVVDVFVTLVKPFVPKRP